MDNFITVSRRVVINPESDSSKLCFLLFYSIVNTLTKKTPKYKASGYPHFLGTILQSEKFSEKVSIFWLREGKLWKQKCQILFEFFSRYI
jgi:hypothetical protein